MTVCLWLLYDAGNNDEKSRDQRIKTTVRQHAVQSSHFGLLFQKHKHVPSISCTVLWERHHTRTLTWPRARVGIRSTPYLSVSRGAITWISLTLQARIMKVISQKMRKDSAQYVLRLICSRQTLQVFLSTCFALDPGCFVFHADCDNGSSP